MKRKILSLLLVSVLLFSGCSVKFSKPVSKSAGDPIETKETPAISPSSAPKTQEDSTTDIPTTPNDEPSQPPENFTYSYNVDIKVEFDEIESQLYFKFTPETFVEALNNANEEIGDQSKTYTIDTSYTDPSEICLTSTGNPICYLTIDPDSRSISRINFTSPTNLLDNDTDDLVGVQLIPFFKVLDPNISTDFAGYRSLDLAMAGQMSSTDDEYVYTDTIGSIRHSVVYQHNFLSFTFEPDPEA